MSHPVRKWTNLVLEAMNEGTLDPQAVADMCLSYMSDFEVEDMCRANDIKVFLEPSSDDDEEL